MNNYLLLIGSLITGCSLIALLLMYLHHRRMKQYYNKQITKYIPEQDRLTSGPERTRMEKRHVGTAKVRLTEALTTTSEVNIPDSEN